MSTLYATCIYPRFYIFVYSDRNQREPERPQTPDPMEINIGKKRFVGKLRKWRRQLHMYDNWVPSVENTQSICMHPQSSGSCMLI